ncbi:MAG: pilin [Patescibacteria group bacterium]|nr:pilin [Patescibacteria group bacterium]
MNKKIKILIIILSIFIVSGFLICANNSVLSAATYDFEKNSGLWNTGYEMTGDEDEAAWFHEQTLPEIIGKVISIILAFLGVLFLILMIYGGYIWMMARGNEQEVEKAKNIIKNALIGLVVVLSAWAITYFIWLYVFISFLKY